MKISRIKHVVITSIIFLVIILVIVAAFTSTINMMEATTQTMAYRVVATKDIEQGELITESSVMYKEIAEDALDSENLIYRLYEDDNRRVIVEDDEKVKEILAKKAQAEANGQADNLTDQEKKFIAMPEDDLWAVGKIAKVKIYKGEPLIAEKIVKVENMVAEETRLYAIPFDSSTTGGYNIELGEAVDICVLYNDNDKVISEYQSLPANKVIDVVLAGKIIADVRDESGNSRIHNGTAVVPGYVCFNLTYEEINTLELARRQGTVFIGRAENYYKEGHQAATFMTGETMPTF